MLSVLLRGRQLSTRGVVGGLLLLVLVRWSLRYYSTISWILGALLSLSAQEWGVVLLLLTAGFFVIPRLLGLGLSLLVFRPMMMLPFEVTVGSATLGRVTNVMVTLSIAELSLVPWFMPLHFQSKPARRKVICAYVRQLSAKVSILSQDQVRQSRRTDPSAAAPADRERSGEPPAPSSNFGGALGSSESLPESGGGEKASQRKPMGGFSAFVIGKVAPLVGKLAAYVVCRTVDFCMVDTRAETTLPELGVVGYELRQLMVDVDWDLGSGAVLTHVATLQQTLTMDLDKGTGDVQSPMGRQERARRNMHSSPHTPVRAAPRQVWPRQRRLSAYGLSECTSSHRHLLSLEPCSVALDVRVSMLGGDVRASGLDVGVGAVTVDADDSLLWRVAAWKALQSERVEDDLGAFGAGGGWAEKKAQGLGREAPKGDAREEGQRGARGVRHAVVNLAKRVRDGAKSRFESRLGRGGGVDKSHDGWGPGGRGIGVGRLHRKGEEDSEQEEDSGLGRARRAMALLPQQSNIVFAGLRMEAHFRLAHAWSNQATGTHTLCVAVPATSIRTQTSRGGAGGEVQVQAQGELLAHLVQTERGRRGSSEAREGLGGFLGRDLDEREDSEEVGARSSESQREASVSVGERHCVSGVTVKAGLVWPGGGRAGDFDAPPALAADAKRTGGASVAALPSVSCEVEVKSVSTRFDSLGLSLARLVKTSLPDVPTSSRGSVATTPPRGMLGGGVGLPFSHVAVSVSVLASSAQIGMRTSTGAVYSVCAAMGEVSCQANGDPRKARSGRMGRGGRGPGMPLAAGARLRGLEVLLAWTDGWEGRSSQLFLMETCSAYATLHGMKPAPDDPITGEVSGVHVRLDQESVKMLATTETPPPSSKAAASRVREDQARSDAVRATPVSVKLHIQNFKAHVGAAFGGAMRGEDTYGEVCWELVRGVVQMHKGDWMHASVVLDSPAVDRFPGLSLRYYEWPGDKRRVYQCDYGASPDVPDFEPRTCTVDPDIERLFFALHSVAVEFRSLKGGRAGGGGGGRIDWDRDWGRAEALWEMDDDESQSEEDSFGEGSNRASREGSLGYSPGSPRGEGRRGEGFPRPGNQGRRDLKRMPSWVRSQAGASQDPESVEVGISGVRVNWRCDVQYGMVELGVAMLLGLEGRKKHAVAASGAGADKAAQQGRRENQGSGGRGGASDGGPFNGKAVNLNFHDIWVFFEATERSIVAVDVGHVQALIEDACVAGAPHSGWAGRVDVRELSVHRVRDLPDGSHRDYATPPPLPGATLSRHGFDHDCASYERRSLSGFSSRSDTLVILRSVGVKVPIPLLPGVVAEVEMEGVCVSIPMPSNISMLGRKEGIKGRWVRQTDNRNGAAHYTDLGVLVFDSLISVKAFQNLIKSRLPSAKESKPTVTELPEMMPEVKFCLSGFEVRIQDDGFEHWVGSYFRLRGDFASEQLKREQLLADRIELHHVQCRNDPALIPITPETQAAMFQELAREGASIWKQRVQHFKRSGAMRDPPPLLYLQVDSFETNFTPRPAAKLTPLIERLDVSGMTAKSPLWPKFETIVGGQLRNLRMHRMTVRIRDYSEPFITLSRIEIGCKSSTTPTSISHGFVIATEEVCPPTHRTVVHKKLHPAAPTVPITRTYGSTKLWADLVINFSEPQISWGPCFMPAISVISLVTGGLSPPGFDPSPKLSSWDKARMMLHGQVALVMDRAALKLLSTPSPYEQGECFQMRGQPITVSYACELPQEGEGSRVGRVKIQAEMVEWAVLSTSREMVSAMLLRKPLFKAVRLDITISLHWKCLGPSLAHHFTQILPKDSYTMQELGSAMKALRKFKARRISRQKSEVHKPRDSPLVSIAAADHPVHVSEAEDAISQLASRSPTKPEGAGGPVSTKKSSLWDRIGKGGPMFRPPTGEKGAAEKDEAKPAVAGDELPAEELPFDTYRLFRSSALAMTVRVSMAAAQTVLHVNTIRWFRKFGEHFERDSDPVNRYIGGLLEGGERDKKLNEKSSFGKHVKAVHLLVLVKQPRMDSFYVGEHRMVGKGTLGDSAKAKNVVVSFSGESLKLQLRIEREARLAIASGGAPGSSVGAAIPLERADEATGNWKFCDVSLDTVNMIANVVPHDLGHGGGEEGKLKGGHPIATAVKVVIYSGESSQQEQQARAGSGDDGGTEQKGAHGGTDGVIKHVENKDLHKVLMRQKSITFKVQGPSSQASFRAPTPAKAATDTVGGWEVCKLQDIVQELKTASNLVGECVYRFKLYRNVFLGNHFVDWAIREDFVKDRRDAVQLGQACIDAKLIRSYISGADVFEDVPAFYRVGTDSGGRDEERGDDEWSKKFKSKRQGGGAPAHVNAAAQGQPEVPGPQFKLILHGMCIQWTMQTREIIHEWFTLLTLATRQHERPTHPQVTPAPAEPKLAAADGYSGLPELSSPLYYAVVASPNPLTSGAIPRFGPLPGDRVSPHASPSEEPSDVLHWGGNASPMQDTSSIENRSDASAQFSLVDHLIRSAKDSNASRYATPQRLHNVADVASAAMRGISSPPNINSSVAAASPEKASALSCRVLWTVEFEDVQLGVETEMRTSPSPGVERMVLMAKSANMQMQRTEEGKAAWGEEGKPTREAMVLTMSGMRAYVVSEDRETFETLNSSKESKADRPEASTISQRWDSTVWGTGIQTRDDQDDHLHQVLAIQGPVDLANGRMVGPALRVTYSYEVDALIGSEERHEKEKKANGGGRVLESGAEVSVHVHSIDFNTDCSEMRAFFNCLNAMMTPLKADKDKIEEADNLRCLVQLMPQVAQDVEKLQEDMAEIEDDITKLQDRHAEVELEIYALGDRGDEQKARLSNEEAALKSELRMKRERFSAMHDRELALKEASQASEQKRQISKIVIEVNGGTWHMGPVGHRLAKVTMRKLMHEQSLDIKSGVPTRYTIHLHSFVLETLLKDQWNSEYKQVVGPLHGSDPSGPQNDREFLDSGACMLSVSADRLPKPKGEQVVYSSFEVNLYPLKVQITEDMANALYHFAFPGSWEIIDDSRQWKEDPSANVLEILEGQGANQKRTQIKQERVFFRLKKTNARPADSLDRSSSLAGDAPDQQPVADRIAQKALDKNSSVLLEDDLPALVAGGRLEQRNAVSVRVPKNPKNKDVEEMRMRARDQVEFSNVKFASCLHTHSYLKISVSYKGRKGPMPDIDALVVNIPQVEFGKPDDGPITCSWQKLYQMWFGAVRWTIVSQVSRSIWSKVKWRRNLGLLEASEEAPAGDVNPITWTETDSMPGPGASASVIPKQSRLSLTIHGLSGADHAMRTYGKHERDGSKEKGTIKDKGFKDKWRLSVLQEAASSYGRRGSGTGE